LDDSSQPEEYVDTYTRFVADHELDFGDAADDMTAATILLLVGGQLVLLTPRKAG